MIKSYVETKSGKNTLRGFLCLPDFACEDQPAPLLVMLHGFSSSCTEKHFMYARLTHALADAGVATLRFDFAGSGESDGEFYYMSVATEIDDTNAILEFAKTLVCVDPGHISLMGYSLSAAVAVNVAAEGVHELERLVLLSPGIIHHKKMEKMLAAEGRIGRGALTLSNDYIRAGYDTDALLVAGDVKCPVTIVRGTDDAAVPRETTMQLLGVLTCSTRFVEIADAGHSFDSPQHYKQLEQAIVSAMTM